ncbi:hypothetical protein [Variovorax sp.]|jgi:hypothetical protein|uniref:hypothetical protein n=1 Tax=Variovorax sp. TaxID=1871043 RepID=UPI0037D9BCB1
MNLTEHQQRLLDEAESWVKRLLETNGRLDVFGIAEMPGGKMSVVQSPIESDDWERALKRTVAELTGLALRREIIASVVITPLTDDSNGMVMLDVESREDGRLTVRLMLKKKMFGGWTLIDRKFEAQERGIFKIQESTRASNPDVRSFTRDDLNLVYPYIVPKSWVDYAGKDALVTWEFSEDVRMVLVVDRLGTVQNVRPQDLEKVHETSDSLFEIATENLSKSFQQQEFEIGGATLLDGREVGYSRGSWMAPAGGLMLSALYQGLQQQFKQDEFAAIAVNQQFLLAFPLDEDTLNSDSLRLAVDDEWRAPKPISQSWLLLDGQWPREYPYTPTFGPNKTAMH